MPGDFGFETEDCIDFGNGYCDEEVEQISSMSAAISHPRCARHADIYVRNAGIEIHGVSLQDMLPDSDRQRFGRGRI